MTGPALWFLLAIALPLYAVMTFADYRRGHADVGLYAKADRDTNPSLFWLYLSLNVTIILLGVTALIGWATELFT